MSTPINVSFAPKTVTTYNVIGCFDGGPGNRWVYIAFAYGVMGYNIDTEELKVRATVGEFYNSTTSFPPLFTILGDSHQGILNAEVFGDKLIHDVWLGGGGTAQNQNTGEMTTPGMIHIYQLPSLTWLRQYESTWDDAVAALAHLPRKKDIAGVTFRFQQAGVSGFTLYPSADIPGTTPEPTPTPTPEPTPTPTPTPEPTPTFPPEWTTRVVALLEAIEVNTRR